MEKLEIICDNYPESSFLKIEGHDDAIIGVYEPDMKLIYSARIIVQQLEMSGMSHEDAEEFYDFNIENAHMGDKTPILCEDRSIS